MNVTVSSREFLQELELLSRVVAAKPTIPVLANFLMQAEGTGLRLAATDLQIGLVTFYPATVHAPGVTTLPAKHLVEIVRLLSDREITLTLERTSVKLTAGKYSSRLQTYPAADYPAMPSMKDLPQFTMPVSLQDMIKRVRFAVSDKNSKKIFFNGALLSSTAQHLVLVATDGHRLAHITYGQNGQPLELAPVILPRKVLDKLLELPISTDTLFAVGQRHLFFVLDGRMLFSQLIDAQFPAYERMIPRETTYAAVIPRQALQDALQRVVLTSIEAVCTFTENLLSITVRSASIGDAAEQLEVQYTGPGSTVSFSGAYLLEFLNVATGPDVTMAWKDAMPILFQASESYRYVQMPMRSV